MFKNVAAKFMVFAFDSTTNLPKTGDGANITAYVSKDYGTVTVLADTTATEMDSTNAKGYYLFDAAQGETNGDCLMVSAKSSTANIVVVGAPAVIYTRPTTGWLAPATAGRTLVVDASGLADANVVKLGPTGSGTAQTARDIGASVLLSPGTGTGQISLSSGGVTLADGVSHGGTQGSSTATLALKSVNITNSAGDAIIATSSGSNGSGLNLTGNGTGSALRGSGGLSGGAGALFQGGGTGHGINAASGTGASGDGIRATASSTNGNGMKLVKAGSGNDFVGNMTSNITGTIDTVTTATTATNLTNAPTAGDFTAAMKTSLNAATPAVTVSDKTGFALTSAYDFAKGTVAMTEAYAADGAAPTPTQALMALQQFQQEKSISSTTMTVKKLDGSTTAMTFTLDSATTPASITRAT